ncbi:oxidoreductase-like protein [Chaetomium strumarium]|uniref:Oxidoreductase-like protein n=1 Tax=Chaetomium strumarium TaxID=1170767 RepID=A0AAJ0GPW7_9PEZI|nr:oxidoreductase-like protein [Chaetomium strumarium]
MTGIALLGAGIFAREEHLPAIEAHPGLALKAVYSRSQQSAETLAALSKDPVSVAIYYDSPAVAGRSLADLLARDDIAAVDVVLPILEQPGVVERAIRAGKHVLSEKPVAGDVDRAQALIRWYEGFGFGSGAEEGKKRPLWGVAENFRFMESLQYAAQRVREIGGDLVTFRLQQNAYIRPENKYLNTEWRKTPEHQGGFLLDGGVHFVAGLRCLLGATGANIRQLAGFTALLNQQLAPVDTVHAVAVTENGKSGTIGLSFGTEFKSLLEVEVVTTNGAVTWNPTEVKTVAGKGDGSSEKVEEKKEFTYSSGVKAEVAAFAKAIEAGKVNALQTPSEALKDLEILQRLLESGAGGATVKTIGL